MIEVAAICLTVLVIAYLGRGAHDLRLRERASERKATDASSVEARVTALEPRVVALEEAEQGRRNLAALARKGGWL